jgi:L-alanine-DL-glutamate epimerase-like enolase superfamily enzyme
MDEIQGSGIYRTADACRMIEETAWVRQRVDIPLVADEAVLTAADIPLLVGAYEGINIKLMKAGRDSGSLEDDSRRTGG